MWPLLVLLCTSAFGQELDLSSIRKLEEKLPAYSGPTMPKDNSVERQVGDNKFEPPIKITRWDKIKNSGTELGAVPTRSVLVRLEDNNPLSTSKMLYLRYYKLEDEHGFKYLVNQDGSTTFKIDSRYVRPIKGELVLYETPSRYRPAPLLKNEAVYDKKLTIVPEAGVYIGYVMGDYMKDLFNDTNARTGISNQVALHLQTGWDLPLKVGGAFHYEQTAYNLTGGGKAHYKSLSFGPMFRTNDREIANLRCRLSAQLRVSPFASVVAETKNGPTDFKFNSTDLFLSFEHPIKNSWGEYVFGAFYQSQWLNLKDQKEIVSVRASNKTNSAFGLSISQVFN